MTAPSFPQRAIERAAEHTGVPAAMILGHRRRGEEVRARWAVMLAMKRRGTSLHAIGRRLGGRDHKTIHYGIQQAEQLIPRCLDFAELVAAVEGA